jgi:ferrochelatase
VHPSTYDAILFLSFGGPEGMDDVMPFLANVLRGKNVPEARMQEVAHHYKQFGGVSPINGQNRNLIKALKDELIDGKIDLPIYWGNRNWHPLLADTLRAMKKDGIKHALAFVTSAYSSFSGCRQYLEDIQRAQEEVPGAPQIDKLRAFYNHPYFIEANTQNVAAALAQFAPQAQIDQRNKQALGEQQQQDQRDPPHDPPPVHLAFTAHSIPTAMAQTCAYQAQLLEACRLVNESDALAGRFKSQALVFQSRSGPLSQPWLEPDILDHITRLDEEGVKSILVHPIGFISDHMEVIFDLDTEAQNLAKSRGIKLVRSQTAGTNPLFVKMIGDLVAERLQSREGEERKAVGKELAAPDICQPGCCAYTPSRPPQKAST